MSSTIACHHFFTPKDTEKKTNNVIIFFVAKKTHRKKQWWQCYNHLLYSKIKIKMKHKEKDDGLLIIFSWQKKHTNNKKEGREGSLLWSSHFCHHVEAHLALCLHVPKLVSKLWATQAVLSSGDGGECKRRWVGRGL